MIEWRDTSKGPLVFGCTPFDVMAMTLDRFESWSLDEMKELRSIWIERWIGSLTKGIWHPQDDLELSKYRRIVAERERVMARSAS